MKKQMLYILFILLTGCTILSCKPTVTVNASTAQQLEYAERIMFEALAKGDSATFRKICGVDYYTINANGEAHNLAETIPYTPRFRGSICKLSEQQQRIYGSFAVRTGRAKIYLKERQVAELLYTSGWVYRDGRWQFVHWQATMAGMMLEPFIGKVSMEPPPVE